MAYLTNREALLTSNSKISENYEFDASAQCANVNEKDLERFLYVINTTDNIVIYDPSTPGLGGVLSGDRIIFTFDTTSMNDADQLLIVYEPKENDDTRQLNMLRYILDELKVNNLYLQEIIGEKLSVDDLDKTNTL